MGQGFCKKTVLFIGAAPDRRILTYCERSGAVPINGAVSSKKYCILIVLSTAT